MPSGSNLSYRVSATRVGTVESITKSWSLIAHNLMTSVCGLPLSILVRCGLIRSALIGSVLIGCTSPTPPQVSPVTRELNQLIKRLPRDEITRDATHILTRLIQAKSINPPGEEIVVVDLIDALGGHQRKQVGALRPGRP